MLTPGSLGRTPEVEPHRGRRGRWLPVLACLAALATSLLAHQNEKRGFDTKSAFEMPEPYAGKLARTVL